MASIIDEFLKGSRFPERLMKESVRSIMVIGESDSGKTTFVEGLADLLSKETATGILDLDMGQSHIGPPTTIAWGRVKDGFRGWDSIRTEDFYFIGALSPPGNLLPALTGARLLLDRAKNSCGKVIIDTTGLVTEPIGRVLKQYKIDLLSPDIVIALEKNSELDPILKGFSHVKRPYFYRIKVPLSVRSKSLALRTGYRADKFEEYFKKATEIKIHPGKYAIRYTREIDGKELVGRVVSFRNEGNHDIAIGVVTGVSRGRLKIRTPMKEGAKFSVLVIGNTVIEI